MVCMSAHPDGSKLLEIVEHVLRVNDQVAPDRRCVVAIAGSVAVGKSTFARHLAEALSSEASEWVVGPHEAGVNTIASDSFLYPNHTLAPLGLEYVKGLPETYDWSSFRNFVAKCRSGAESVRVPVYSHSAFDIVGTKSISPDRIVVVEGINSLQDPVHDAFDLRMYLDAPHEVIARWYVDRFLGFIIAAESDPSSFYTRFVALNPGERRETAQSVWDSINLPNLVRHIEPSKTNADLCIVLDSDHRIVNVEYTNATSI
jgi:type I pantothenate kinase